MPAYRSSPVLNYLMETIMLPEDARSMPHWHKEIKSMNTERYNFVENRQNHTGSTLPVLLDKIVEQKRIIRDCLKRYSR